MISRYFEGTRNLDKFCRDTYVDYYIIKSEDSKKSDYGVEVIKKRKDFGREIVLESEAIYNITKNEEEAQEIVDKIIGNSVTPVALCNVIEDLQKL